jgi:stage III sporulation protein AB
MLLIKALGGICVISACGVWGLKASRSLERRREQLKDLRMAMNFLEKEITYMHTPLSLALARTAYYSEAPISFLFELSSRYLSEKKGLTGGEAWSKGISFMRKHADLKEKDIALLKTAAQQLGMSDASEQKKYFALLQEQLKILEERALQEADKGQKIWSYGGFVLGFTVVLLLL